MTLKNLRESITAYAITLGPILAVFIVAMVLILGHHLPGTPRERHKVPGAHPPRASNLIEA